MISFYLISDPMRFVEAPTNWLDLTLAQLLTLWSEPELPRIHVLCGLTVAEVNALWPADLRLFTACFEFMLDRASLQHTLHLLLS